MILKKLDKIHNSLRERQSFIKLNNLKYKLLQCVFEECFSYSINKKEWKILYIKHIDDIKYKLSNDIYLRNTDIKIDLDKFCKIECIDIINKL